MPLGLIDFLELAVSSTLGWRAIEPLGSRFPSSPFIIRVPCSLLFGLNKGTLNYKGQKGTTQKPRASGL